MTDRAKPRSDPFVGPARGSSAAVPGATENRFGGISDQRGADDGGRAARAADDGVPRALGLNLPANGLKCKRRRATRLRTARVPG